MRGFLYSILAGSAVLLAACAAPPEDIGRPEPRPLGREFTALSRLPLQVAPAASGPASRNATASGERIDGPGLPLSEEPAGTIILRQALALSLTGSPELAVFSYETRAAEARTLQAGFRPNPEIAMLTEDFGGNRARGGFQQSQSTLSPTEPVTQW